MRQPPLGHQIPRIREGADRAVAVGAAAPFEVLVCTPRWLDRRVRGGGPLIGRHHLVIERWDAARIQLCLTAAVESEDAPTWSDLATRVGRIGKWEFEDDRA